MWKTYIGNYEMNELGQLRNSKTGRILKPKISNKGYVVYGISLEGKYKDVSAHRAVATLFVDNPEGKPVVNHKDGNKQNNCYTNLEWATNSENTVHAVQEGMLTNDHCKIAVYQIDNKGNVINTYPSVRAAARAVNGYSSKISNCCTGKQVTHKGFRWAHKPI
ncbi:HNH homing endonuclease [Bacillus phage Mater]|uniref:HNH homing endonuclease n=1 Tax=Bacillus phage Mater TaxID=1540090 RepID=A0A0A0RMX2_9CAUD|nr:HNH endonuclease [Bacillus phage Mater]AIW03342.1 HNH homing endonuclease [Bacillus phage Mater]